LIETNALYHYAKPTAADVVGTFYVLLSKTEPTLNEIVSCELWL